MTQLPDIITSTMPIREGKAFTKSRNTTNAGLFNTMQNVNLMNDQGANRYNSGSHKYNYDSTMAGS